VLDGLEAPADSRWQVQRSSGLPPEDDTLGVLQWVHDSEHLERVRAAAEQGSGWLDSHDCLVSAGTFTAAVSGAGLVLQAALDLVNGRLQRTFVVSRPPGHHAERARARGFCFFNGAAVAAEVIVRSWVRPVVVVDFDALHGNGTQQHFYDRADVGFLSVHRYPHFPGSGAGDEIGEGAGSGSTRNIPLAAGADDEVFCAAFETGLAELAPRLRPAAIVVSAGFNGLASDPVGGMRLTAAGYGRMTAAIVEAAEAWADGRVLSVLEGGFDPVGLAGAARAQVEALAGGTASTSPRGLDGN
jgi:acetoin utilization deacetylase AcuC-like enzyme